MDQGPLVMEEIDAGAELVDAFDKYQPVKAAFWLKATDEEERYLYLASDGINDANFDLGYGEVLRLVNQMQTPYLDPFRVKLIGGDNALAAAAIDVYRRFPRPMPTRIRAGRFGGLTVDEVYLYPPPHSVPVP